ncbi:MAG: Mini-ribonuclease 3 [Solobacterium sp.]|nr:Mini-ribonuclease 3 [Solobacterium sp.]
MKTSECSGRTLAFLGDAAWSLIVREYLVENGDSRGKDLQQHSTGFVSAKAQAAFYAALHEEGFFTQEEEDLFRRGRNANAGSIPHHTDVQTYRMSTGFEALIGGLQLEKKQDRIREIFEKVLRTEVTV